MNFLHHRFPYSTVTHDEIVTPEQVIAMMERPMGPTHDMPHIWKENMSGSGRFIRDLSCSFCVTHEVCDACRSTTGFLRDS